MFRGFTAWAVALLVCAGSLAAAQGQNAKVYSLAELRALADQEGWRELAANLSDISPTRRDAVWRGLAERTALGLLAESDPQADPLDAVLAVERLIDLYPVLKGARPVMDKRAEVGLRAFGRCFAESYDISFCNDAFTAFIAKDPSNLDLAFRAGKLVRLNAFHWVSAPYFRKALVTRSSLRRCADEDVRLAVLSALALPEDYPAVKDGTTIASSQCWDELRAPLLAALATESSYYRANVCPILVAKDALTADARRLCAP